jgi:hypothetical protein
MKENKRAQRRREKEKRKKKARAVYKDNDIGEAEKLADHLANCSCAMCRNPRRSSLYKGNDKLTLQERKELEKEKEEENDQ